MRVSRRRIPAKRDTRCLRDRRSSGVPDRTAFAGDDTSRLQARAAIEEAVDCPPELFGLRRQSVRGIQQFRGRGACLTGGARHAGDVVADVAGAVGRLLHVAGDLAGRGALLLDGGGDRAGYFVDLGDRASDRLDRADRFAGGGLNILICAEISSVALAV